jgi:hypothetical protein
MDLRRDPQACVGLVVTILLCLISCAAGCGLGWLIGRGW